MSEYVLGTEVDESSSADDRRRLSLNVKIDEMEYVKINYEQEVFDFV